MSNNKEQVIVDLETYLQLKQEASNNQVLNVVVQVAAYVMGKPFEDALKSEGILIDVKGNSLATTEVAIDIRNFQTIQEMRQQAFKSIKNEIDTSRKADKEQEEGSSSSGPERNNEN